MSEPLRITITAIGDMGASDDTRLIHLLEQVMLLDEWTPDQRARAARFLEDKYCRYGEQITADMINRAFGAEEKP